MQDVAPYSMRVTFPNTRADNTLVIEPMAPAQEHLSLREAWGVIRSHLGLIVVFFLSTMLATGLVLMYMPTTYTAEVTLLIERKPPRVLDIHDASGDSLLPDEYDFYKTQYELLKSRTLAAQVMRELALHPLHLQQSSRPDWLHGIITFRQ